MTTLTEADVEQAALDWHALSSSDITSSVIADIAVGCGRL